MALFLSVFSNRAFYPKLKLMLKMSWARGVSPRMVWKLMKYEIASLCGAVKVRI